MIQFDSGYIPILLVSGTVTVTLLQTLFQRQLCFELVSLCVLVCPDSRTWRALPKYLLPSFLTTLQSPKSSDMDDITYCMVGETTSNLMMVTDVSKSSSGMKAAIKSLIWLLY